MVRITRLGFATLPVAGLLSVFSIASALQGSPSQVPAEIMPTEEKAGPENLTSTKNGTVYFGSTTKGTVYRAMPGSAQAEPWIIGEAVGLKMVLGVLADEKSNTLWVAANGAGAQRAPEDSILRAFDLKTGAPKGAYPAPEGGLLNDMAVAADGSVYVSDMTGGRILRLKPKAEKLEVWLADAAHRGIDGLTFLADGALYFNNYSNGKLLRVRVAADGTAGEVKEIETPVPFKNPDGMRTLAPNKLIQIEGSGRLTEITINGDKAEVKTLREGLTRGTGVTVVGKTAYALVERLKAIAVKL